MSPNGRRPVVRRILLSKLCINSGQYHGIEHREADSNVRIHMLKRTGLLAALIFLLVAGSLQPSQAASKATKPGAPVKATPKDILLVGPVGFMDESYCYLKPHVFNESDGCDRNNFVTTWAFSIKNLSKTLSASKVRVRITFYDSAGQELAKFIESIASEVKPGKTAYGASAWDQANASFTGVAKAKAEIVSNGWMIPTTAIYQNPIYLEQSVGEKRPYDCQLGKPCTIENQDSRDGALTNIKLNGIFTWRGTGQNSNYQIIFLDSAGNPLGGWTVYASYTFRTGSQDTPRIGLSMTDFELGNVVNYLFVIKS